MFFNRKIKVKRGFTLLELIVILSLLSVGTLLFAPNLKVYSDKKAEIEMNYAVDGIIEAVNIGKSYGRLKDTRIFIKFMPQKIVITEGLNQIQEFQLPPSIRSINLSDGINSIEINGFGQIVKAKSIEVNSYNGLCETITIKVGTSYVSKKK